MSLQLRSLVIESLQDLLRFFTVHQVRTNDFTLHICVQEHQNPHKQNGQSLIAPVDFNMLQYVQYIYTSHIKSLNLDYYLLFYSHFLSSIFI